MELVTGAVALTTLVGGVTVVAVLPETPHCIVRAEMRKDGPTKVTSCNDGSVRSEPLILTHTPAPGTGGLVLRNAKGRDLGSGIGQKQRFQFMYCGPKDSGLIYVNQVDRKTTGGWGGLYAGYVKKKYTSSPASYPCN